MPVLPEPGVLPVAAKVRECAGCKAPGPFEVWDQPMCLACAHAWDAEAPKDELWDEKYPEDKARFAAKKTWTGLWCERRKTRAA